MVGDPRPRLRVVMFSATPHEISAFENERKLIPESKSLDMVYVKAQLDTLTAALAAGATAVSCFSSDRGDAQTLRVLQSLGVQLVTLRYAGCWSVDVGAAWQCGLTVAPAPAHAPTSIAEYSIALMLALSRKVHLANQRVRNGDMSMQGLVGFDLGGKTVGIIGTGKVGRIVVRILSGFGCRVLAYDMVESPEVAELGARYVQMNMLLASSDVISLHAPLVPGTRHMIGRDTLSRCKKGVHIVNTSCGGLIHVKAAIEALLSGQLGALALDAYEDGQNLFTRDDSKTQMDPDLQLLRSMPNVVITGHQAASTTNALASIAKATLKTLLQFHRGEDLEYERRPNPQLGAHMSPSIES